QPRVVVLPVLPDEPEQLAVGVYPIGVADRDPVYCCSGHPVLSFLLVSVNVAPVRPQTSRTGRAYPRPRPSVKRVGISLATVGRIAAQLGLVPIPRIDIAAHQR